MVYFDLEPSSHLRDHLLFETARFAPVRVLPIAFPFYLVFRFIGREGYAVVAAKTQHDPVKRINELHLQ